MNKQITMAAIVATLAIGTTAAGVTASEKTSAEVKTIVEKQDDGGYKQVEERKVTDTQGTTTIEKRETKLDVSGNGDIKKTIEVEKSVDPKGLFNKTTVKSKDTVAEQTKEGSFKSSAESSLKDAAGTATKASSETKVNIDEDGDVKEVRKQESSEDPEGLMNKSSAETESTYKSVDGRTEVEQVRKVDGRTVERTRNSY